MLIQHIHTIVRQDAGQRHLAPGLGNTVNHHAHGGFRRTIVVEQTQVRTQLQYTLKQCRTCGFTPQHQGLRQARRLRFEQGRQV
ncbi:hypothetical protein D9M71_772300 [compost metagenome]